MILDAEDLEPGATLAADVCIVGAGAAGMTLALALAERGVSTLVLESGGREVAAPSEALNEGTMSGLDTWSLDSHRRRVLGGSTIRWAGWCMPMAPYDFEARPYVPHSGWPIDAADLEPFAARAHRRVQLADPEWDTATLAEHSDRPLVDLPGGRAEIRTLQYSPPTRFGAHWGPTLEASDEATVYLHATVVEVRLDAARDRVESLRCKTLRGTPFEVQVGRCCVLALGGIENARLLLASDEQRPEGVANGSDNVGRYFMEHPHLSAPLVLRTPDLEQLGYFARHSVRLPHGDGTLATRLRGMFALTAETLEREGLLDFTAAVDAQDDEPGLTGPIAAEDVSALFAAGRPTRNYRLYMRCEQSPLPGSRITLRSETDALGMRRADLEWKIAEDDWRSYTKAAEILGAELAAAGLGRLWIRREGDLLWHRPGPGGHHMGSTRMSRDPSEGVVDGDCRAHDVENLYLAGSSVFTTGGAPNPTLTLVTLAERLAAHLAEEVL